jgi:MoxR-like ATPase
MKAIEKENLIQALQNANGTGIFTRKEIMDVAQGIDVGYPAWIFNNKGLRTDTRGQYNLASMFTGQAQVLDMPQVRKPLPQAPILEAEAPAPAVLTQAILNVQVEDLVPGKDATYVPYGFYKDLKQVLTSTMFYPIFISGLSGNGKTTMVEQVCANLKREAIRVNISIETDEDDLIGGNTLVDGNVVYREGPVLTAMKRGAVLILDEVDRGSNKLMCLQAILEGKPYFNKKTGETVTPAPGFNIVATANTKGRGSDDGKFISANILDEAFLERFAITVEQEYPTLATEKKIVLKKMEKADCVDDEFALHLVTWSDVIRRTYYDGAIDELVSTRRLEHIVNAFAMFKDKTKAIELCVNRFYEDTKAAFIDFYGKVDPTIQLNEGEETPSETTGDEVESEE